MSFLIITHVKHTYKDGKWCAYGPYVREMNIWLKQFNHILILAPKTDHELPDEIDLPYVHPYITFIEVPSFHFTHAGQAFKALYQLPIIVIKMFLAMFRASHIHVRCPGNMGLIAMFLQILFPFKPKTAKYAGNWDPNSNQPLSYRVQQYLLNNRLLTHKMKAIIYGEWPHTSRNIIPFFTASYHENQRGLITKKHIEPLQPILFMVVGTLTENKGPLQALSWAHQLKLAGLPIQLHYYGDGPLKDTITEEAKRLNMTNEVSLFGNVNANELIHAYKKAHFLFLLSKSEGWPKAVAEAMWWGVVPITKPVSCLPWMLANGERGILIDETAQNPLLPLMDLITHPDMYSRMSKHASEWSQTYTLEKFEQEIKNLV